MSSVEIEGIYLISINFLHAEQCFMLMLLPADLKKNEKKSFRNTIRLSNCLDSDQGQHSVGPDLGPNCLQRLSADNKSLS